MRNRGVLCGGILMVTILFIPLGALAHARLLTATSESDTPTYDRGESAAADTCPIRTGFENSLETDHFILQWTNNSSHRADNIADPAIVRETAEYLETAWGKYVDTFGKAPYRAPGKDKIVVTFRDLDCFGQAGPPDAPIVLDSDNWVEKPGIRKPTSAHELFHKLQYAFGYRTKWNPNPPFKWFTEGTAAWAEVFVWQRVSGAYKIKELFANPDLDLYESEDCALPFWIFFETRYETMFHENPLVAFFKEYERTGNEKAILSRMIGRLYGPMDNFFALFSLERQSGYWLKPQRGSLYASILGPDGKNIVPRLKITEVPVHMGENYRKSSSVPKFGSGYYRFKLAPNTEGRFLHITVTGKPVNGASCIVGWEKEGTCANETPSPQESHGRYTFVERIDLQKSDSVMVIISGGGKGGEYTISASVS